MKIILDIPEWAQERHIYILAGIELLAYKKFGTDELLVKTDRCNRCGDCCENIAGKWLYSNGQGGCIYLQKEPGDTTQRSCMLRTERPLCCSISDPVLFKQKDAEDWCSIRYKKVPVE